MAGNKDVKLLKLAEKGKWKKVSVLREGADTETKVKLAEMCGESDNEIAHNMLVSLIKDDDYNVKLRAIKAIAAVGIESNTTHLRWILDRTPEDQTELIEAIRNAIVSIKGKK